MTTTREKNRPARKRRPRPKKHGGEPLPLYKRSSSHFRPQVRDLGTQLHEAGGVDLTVEGERARARVTDSEGEAIGAGLDWTRVASKRALHAYCECRGFSSGRPCEHLWAMLLELGDAPADRHPAGRDRVSLRKDRAPSWPDLGVSRRVGAVSVGPPPGSGRRRKGRAAAAHGKGRGDGWSSRLAALRSRAEKLATEDGQNPAESGAPGFEDGLRLLINTKASLAGRGLILDLFVERPAQNGRRGKIKRTSLEPEALADLFEIEPEEASSSGPVEIVTAVPIQLKGRSPRGRPKKKGGKAVSSRIQRIRLPRRLYRSVLSHLSDREALGWWDGRRPSGGRPLAWDDGEPWRLALSLEPAGGESLDLLGSLERDGRRVPLGDALLFLDGAPDDEPLVVFRDSVADLDTNGRGLAWVDLLRGMGGLQIPGSELDEALTELMEIPGMPRLAIPDGLAHDDASSTPRPRLVLTQDAASVIPNAPLLAELSFRYGELEVSAADPRPTIVEWPGPTLLKRDLDREHEELVRLLQAGVEPVPGSAENELQLRPHDVPSVAEPLLLAGWEVEVRGTSLRAPKPPTLKIESGIDWFELGGEFEYPGDEIDLKTVLAAVEKGERFVELKDGSQGLLPSSWSETYDSLAQLALDDSDDGLRFLPSQALLVDALLTEMPPAAVDAAFSELREKLSSFERIKPKKEPRGFKGELRAYQRAGLGWLAFLREFGLGGVLADDMGLGKTVQVLALLRAYRTPKKSTGLPWLVVVPRSLLYNWIEEAGRFTPDLKVVEYGGRDREALRPKLAKQDLVVTTYGTLRRDIGYLATVEFDTVILDEAQAIKNRESQSAKSSRLLQARNRLALTGTPIENHLGELGSLFEFLNPGLLGRLPALEVLASGRKAGKGELAKVAAGIRPFILRRTKAEVLPDLPPKTEQVLHTELNERQRELYDQLRAGYQATLLDKVESDGVGGSSIQVLEALLRLRQIACHPGLVNDEWAEAGSAKLDTLFELVFEVLDEGHKVLVFSQFTKLLGFVRDELESRGIDYAYLDGQTRKRREVVDRFQTDPDCNLFLISLKAGGVGLNLTAAGYVFLLDPWWNPAVEAQAIDRTHRIGQTQPVFAYRLIASDTVEEKIVKLQSAKRDLADAILDGGEKGPLSELTADDLKMLLS